MTVAEDQGLVVPMICGGLVLLRPFRSEDAVREASGDPLVPHTTTVPDTAAAPGRGPCRRWALSPVGRCHRQVAESAHARRR